MESKGDKPSDIFALFIILSTFWIMLFSITRSVIWAYILHLCLVSGVFSAGLLAYSDKLELDLKGRLVFHFICLLTTIIVVVYATV